jgi:hypothetical protein
MAQMDYETAEELARRLVVTIGFATRAAPQPAFDLVVARRVVTSDPTPNNPFVCFINRISSPVRSRASAGLQRRYQAGSVTSRGADLERAPEGDRISYLTSTEYCSKVPDAKECFADATSSAWDVCANHSLTITSE